MTDQEIEVLISRLLNEMHTGPELDVMETQTVVKALTLMVAVRNAL